MEYCSENLAALYIKKSWYNDLFWKFCHPVPVIIILSFSFIVLHVKQSWYSDQSVISIIFSLFWKSHRSSCYPVMIRRSYCLLVVFFPTSDDPLVEYVPLSFLCFENAFVLHVIQLWSNDQNVALPFHCF